MARYQIRTDEDVYLEDVIDRMAQCAWKILETWQFFDPPHPSKESFRRFHNTIRETLGQSVRTFKLCGLSNICLENLESTPWAPDSHVLDANPWDKIYHLFPKSTLESFLQELTQNTIASSQQILKSNFEKETYSTLQIVFQAILGEYLYKDPACGKTEFCVFSSSAPVKIWQENDRRSQSLDDAGKKM